MAIEMDTQHAPANGLAGTLKSLKQAVLPAKESINGHAANGHAVKGHANGHAVSPAASQPTDAQLWKKANKSLMNIGVGQSPIMIRRAKGAILYDVNGREILDFTSGQMSSILGHSHPEIVQTVSEQMGTLDHLLSNFVSQPVAELADYLTSLMPAPLDKTFFLNTGSETNEAAIKIAKCATGKFEIIGFSASYHGLTGAAGAATFSCARKGGGPVMPGQLVFPTPNAYTSPFKKADGSYDWEAEMTYGWDLIDRQTVGSLAAFLIEPILSTGGIIELPKGYMKRLLAECRKREVLLIVDEAQTGCGRTGDLWAFQYDDIVPDIVTLSKTLGAGLPMAAVVTTSELERKAIENGFIWLTTHENDPLTAAVGLKVMQIVMRDNLTERAARLGKVLRRGLLDIQAKHGIVADVRGRGLLQGIQVVAPKGSSVTGDKIGQLIGEKAMDLGLSCNIVNVKGFLGVFRIAPPLTVTDEELHKAIRLLDESFTAVLQDMSAAERDSEAAEEPRPAAIS